MNSTSLMFLAGVVAVQQFSRLPNMFELLGLGMCCLPLIYRRYWRVFALVAGVLWASLYGDWRLTQQLPEAYQNRDVKVQGYIASLPQQQDQRTNFDFIVTAPADDFPDKIRLSWYFPQLSLAAGQSWEFHVKLRKPHGRLNPGGFDFEAWLFSSHIGATGYVRDKPAPQLASIPLSIGQYFAKCRQAIAERLDAALPGSPQTGIIKALTIGSQDAITQQQWQVFRITGVVHLIVISGSHISLIAGLIYLWTRRLWAWTGTLNVSPQRAAALCAWLAAVFYAGLAGYSVPTLRAVIMLSVALAAIAWQRNTAPMRILLLALLAVLLFDPLAVLSVGFWLSFVAVALLIYVSAGRLGRPSHWREAGGAQLATAVGLSPLLIVFFQQVSLISPVANWLAVPVIGILIVPPALLAVVFLFIWPALAALLLNILDSMLQGLWWILWQMAELPLASVYCLPPPWHAVGLAAMGVLLLLAPRGFPCRHLSPLLFLPLIFVAVEKPKPGEAWLTVLDVGQGLAAVVQTAEHSLVFDTGARYSEYSDMGDSVVLPFLREQGVDRVDSLVISHGDNDHSGGADSILAELPVDKVVSSVIEWAARERGEYCRSGQTWRWDDVSFEILSPPESGFASDNDNSCVLQVSTARQRFLLTGDIEQAAETWLVREYGDRLASDVLLAPHHGSKTSSSLALLEMVNPKLILIPAGYQNRFGFPHRQVTERYSRLGIPWLNSAEQGAISVHSGSENIQLTAERVKRQRYWRTPVPNRQSIDVR
ncbi:MULTISPECIES: DNA internalization-related competence protein ComEC/Rec2 [Methylomonas]|uniref:Competence protein ComEC n=2 Tax=Methylomonas TaxID=416 RepID=A0A140E6M7_9GAMM|nr:MULTISPECIES: DNA internalization-related competence protein ComEC/Rec2 [Methylomonas]AMK79051.1 competence protein ComEC [Methylomonas denitrificans]OAI00214.1 competence protein ComEC [Methylomonas methanica]TCV79156.1 competence protein ComEC [Methylomonas methanica]